MPPPVPEYHQLWDFAVSLGAASPNGPQWEKYGICSDTADTAFTPPGRDDKTGQLFGYVLGVDAVVHRTYPCKITLTDTKDKTSNQSGQSWASASTRPHIKPDSNNNFDKAVIACPAATGFVPLSSGVISRMRWLCRSSKAARDTSLGCVRRCHEIP